MRLIGTSFFSRYLAECLKYYLYNLSLSLLGGRFSATPLPNVFYVSYFGNMMQHSACRVMSREVVLCCDMCHVK